MSVRGLKITVNILARVNNLEQTILILAVLLIWVKFEQNQSKTKLESI